MASWEHGKRLLQGVNVSAFTGGKAFRKYVCQHFLKEILYLFIVSCWHLNLLLLSVAEGRWWGFCRCLVSLAFTGWEKWSLALSSSHTGSRRVFPLVTVALAQLLQQRCWRCPLGVGAPLPSHLGHRCTGIILHWEAAKQTLAFRNVACNGSSVLLQIY